jgi:hypothetical protein
MKTARSASFKKSFARLIVRLLFLLMVVPSLTALLRAQGLDLTVVVLVNSSNTAGYNTSQTTPGSYQMGPERYLANLQMPYRVIDVSKTSAIDLSTVQLVVAGHAGLNPNAAWQAAIVSAVGNGTGFVNLDSDLGIGTQTHILTIFGASGASPGGDQTSIVIPAAVQSGGATPHYIAALQRHWAGDPAGDLTYNYHGNGVTVIPSNATILSGAKGTVVAKLGTDPLIIATSYGKGRAVDFTTYDYLHADRFGFVMGADDLFWRSLVWAARKPFVLRGYPRFAAIQMDDNEVGLMSRIPDLWNTTLTGKVAADATGGPWAPQVNLQLSSLASAGGERAQLIAAVKAGNVHASPHGLNYGSGGDLYWNLTMPNTDSQWQANVAATTSWQTGQGGSDTFPKFSSSMVAHYWDLSNNSGYEMWNTLGLRYITSAQAPGAYYFTLPKSPSQRLPLGPFRIYEQPPTYTGDYEETFPFFYADDLSVGSVAGKPAQTFFSFASEVGQSAGRFPRQDALFPSTQNGYTVANSLNQWEYYMWHFWSGMEPVQIYTHDGANLQFSTTADRQAFITKLSQWFSTNKGTHVFMDNMGDYLRARNHSLLATATLSSSVITLKFTGSATDADGHLIPTKTYIFYGDDEGALLAIPGFANGGTFTFATNQPASMQIDPLSLSFTAVAGTSPASQSVNVLNVGSGSFNWSATSNASWLSVTPTSGLSSNTAQIKVSSTTLAAGTYNGQITFTALNTLNSPYSLPVTLTVTPATASLVVSPTSLTFSGSAGGTAPPSQSLNITNPSGTSLGWTASSDSSWLTSSVITAGTPGTLSVSVVPGTLQSGTYVGHITLTPTSGTATAVTVPVTLQLSGVLLAPSTASLAAWTISPLGNLAGWSSSGGALHYNGSGEAPLYAGTASWTDYDLNVSFTLNSTSDYPGGIRARVNPANGSGYALWLYPAEHSITLFKVVNWSIDSGYTSIATTNNIVFDTSTHTLRLSAYGSQISAAYDGKTILTVTDATYSTGLIALDPSSQPIAFSNVVINSSVSPTTSITATPSTLSFSAAPNAPSGASQNISLTSSPASVTWTATSNVAWLTLNPGSGSVTPATITVSATAVGLGAGVYSGAITFVPSAGSSIQAAVTLTVSSAQTAMISVAPSALDIFSALGSSPPPVSVAISNTGTGALSWTATSDSSWLVTSPTSGSAPTTLTLTSSSGALTSGAHLANISIASTNATNSPVLVPVTIHLGSTIFSDTFASGSTQWTPSPLGLASNWSIASNSFNYNGQGHTQQYAGSPSWTDYIVSTNITLANLSDYPGGLRGRVNTGTGAAYVAWLYPAEKLIKLFRCTAWNIDSAGLTLLGQSPIITMDTKPHALRLWFAGNQISVFYDNAKVITATDSTLTAGAIALDVSSQPVSFSNISILQ